MWVRGLKPCLKRPLISIYPSHPVWVRGLKHAKYGFTLEIATVAPRVGAWIETFDEPEPEIENKPVAPRVGAWIETFSLIIL